MKVNLIKRKYVVHAGIRIRADMQDLDTCVVSVCSRTWYDHDKTSIGESTEVTCKRCMKYIIEAEENDGVINFKSKRR